jgi:hypothetical protein
MAGSEPKPKESALSHMERAGVTKMDNGDLRVPADVLKRLRNERLRKITVAGVPSTPRFLTRDGGGVGVAKGGHKVYQVTIESLRAIRERGPIFQSIHAARHYQVRRMARPWTGKRGDVGFRVTHKDHTNHNAKVPEGFQPFIDRFQGVLERPAPQYGIPTLGAALTGLEEDLLTINRPTAEILYSALDRERVVGFRPVDGGIIWPTLLWIEKWKADNPRWHGRYNADELSPSDQMELASHAVGADLFTAEFALVRDGILEAVYQPGKLLVAPLRNRTDINTAGYPPSHVEQALEMGVGFINAWDYNHNYFTRGMLAEFMIGISGDVHDDDVDAFVDMLRESTQGVGRAWQPPVMPMPQDGVISKIDLKQSNKEMMYEVWLSLTLAMCSAVYRMDPSTINAKPWDGGQSSGLGAPNRNMEIALAKEEGLQGDLQHLADTILTPMARRCHPDLRVVFEYGDFDAEKEARVYEVRSRVDMTRNEVRMEQGLEPRGFWVALEDVEGLGDEERDKYDANLWNQPADPGFVNAYAQAKQMEQFAQQQEGGMPGEEPGGMPGQDDGFGAPPPEQEPGQDDGFGGDAFGGEDDGFGGGGESGYPFGQVPEGMTKGVRRRRPGVTVYVHDLHDH